MASSHLSIPAPLLFHFRVSPVPSFCVSVCPCTPSLPFGLSPVASSSSSIPTLLFLLRVSILSFCLSLHPSCPHGDSEGSVPWLPLVCLSLQPSSPCGGHPCAVFLSVPVSLHLFFSLSGSVPCLSPSICLSLHPSCPYAGQSCDFLLPVCPCTLCFLALLLFPIWSQCHASLLSVCHSPLLSPLGSAPCLLPICLSVPTALLSA